MRNYSKNKNVKKNISKKKYLKKYNKPYLGVLSRLWLCLVKMYYNKLFRFLIKWGTVLLVAIICILTVSIAYFAHDLPDIEELSKDVRQPNITVRAPNGVILANYGDIYGQSLSYHQFPKYLIDAVIATEDRRFFEHSGIDIWGVLRAMYYNKKAGRVVQGGSTITQQLAKIVFLSPERSIKRKVQELLLAFQLEDLFSKEQIITIYLNRVFLGHGNFGVDAAAKYYFGKRINNLTVYEAAVIAGMLKAPSKYSPANNTNLALLRGKQVLLNMVDAKLLTETEMRRATYPHFMSRGKARGILENPYFTDYVLEQLPNFVTNINQDLNIYTTFDIELQQKIEEAVKLVMQDSETKYNAKQAAVVVMAKDGAIKAMLGGVSYGKSQFNRATSAKRQPGSAFKLFVYLAALEHGYKLQQYLEDKDISINKWHPKNFSRKFVGNISLQDAFAYSINTIAVQLIEQIGIDNVLEMSYRLGIKDKLPNLPSIALGSGEVRLVDITAAYAVIANNGIAIDKYLITKITDSNNQTLYQYSAKPAKKILANDIINQMLAMLQASVDYGTSKAAKIIDKEVFGKTGTTQDFNDAWFIGFTDNLITGVWVGNDDNKHMKNITGGTLPAIIWREFTKKTQLHPY